MLGQDVAYERTPYFFSDQYDLGMEYRGWAPAYDEVVFRGDPGSGAFLCFWLRDGMVASAMNVNVWDAGEELEVLIQLGRRIDVARLADPEVALAELVEPSAE